MGVAGVAGKAGECNYVACVCWCSWVALVGVVCVAPLERKNFWHFTLILTPVPFLQLIFTSVSLYLCFWVILSVGWMWLWLFYIFRLLSSLSSSACHLGRKSFILICDKIKDKAYVGCDSCYLAAYLEHCMIKGWLLAQRVYIMEKYCN